VESGSNKSTTPITFEWTGIQYLELWEAKYEQYHQSTLLKDSQKIAKARPIPFNVATQSFRLPTQVQTTFLERVAEMVQNHPASSSTELTIEHQGQHQQCPAYNQLIQKLSTATKPERPHILMLTRLPQEETEKTIKVSMGEESYTPRRNLPYISF